MYTNTCITTVIYLLVPNWINYNVILINYRNLKETVRFFFLLFYPYEI